MADNRIRVKAYGKILNFPAGTKPDAIESALAEHEPTLNPNYKTPEPEALDYAKSFASGANKLVSGVGFLMEAAGGKEMGKATREFGNRGAQYWNDKMSKGGKLAAKSQVFVDDDNEDSLTGIKLSDDWAKALLMGASQSLPSMLAAAIPGVAVTKGIQVLARLGLAGGSGATIPLLAGAASPVGVTSNIIARAPSALAFGAAEGVTAGAMNAAEFKTSIENMTDEELSKSPIYRALKTEHGPDNAKSLLAEQASKDLFGSTALSTGAIGAVTGGGALSQAYQKATTGAKSGILGTMVKGAGTEALQEAPQSAGEQYLQNVTTKDFLDPTKDTSEGVATAAASGAAIGGLMGGVVGAGGAINITPDRRTQVLDEKRKIAEMKASTANARQQEQDMADIGAAQDVDQVIAAANKATKSSINADDVLRAEDPTLADIERLTGLKPTEAIDTAIDEINNPQEELKNDNAQTQQATTTQTPVLNEAATARGTGLEGEARTTKPIVESPVPEVKDTGAEIQAPVADASMVLDAETFKATGGKRTYDQYLREHPNRKQAAAIDGQNVEDTLVKGLQKTGKFNAKDSKTYAKPFGEFYRVNAERQGILPSELYARMPLNFSGKGSGKFDLKQNSDRPFAKITESFLKDSGKEDVIASPGVLRLYHGTSQKNASSIEHQGEFRGHSFFTPDEKLAKRFSGQAGGRPKVVSVLVDSNSVLPTGGYLSSRTNKLKLGEDGVYRSVEEAPKGGVLNQQDKIPTINVKGVERPTVNSEGKSIPNPEKFHEWFGDSKVVDKEGRPLTVYHGTGKDFSEFSADKGEGARYKTGVFFSDSPNVASTYASGENKNVMKAYVSLKNPVVVDVKGANWDRLDPSVSVALPEATVADKDEKLLAELEDRAPDKNASRKLKARETSLKELFPKDMGYPDDTMSTNDLVRWAREQGYEGVVLKNVTDTGPSGVFHTEAAGKPRNSFVVFDPTKIKSAIGNNGEFNPEDANILKQSKKSVQERTLIAQHNISMAGLMHADKMGGLAAPSLAVADKSKPLTGFGEITLIADPSVVDPEQGAKVFGADIYSPRYPSITLVFDRKSVDRLNEKLKPFTEATNSNPIGFYELNLDGSEREVNRNLRQEPAVLAAFLTEKGITPKYKERPKAVIAKELKPFAGVTDAQTLVLDPNFLKAVGRLHREFLDEKNSGNYTQSDKDRFLRNLAYDDAHRVVAYSKYLKGKGRIDPGASFASMRLQIDAKKLSDELEVYVRDLVHGMRPEEKLFKGFTYSGSRRYSPHTLENVVKELKKNIRGGENFSYGLGTVRSKYTPQFRSLDQIRKEKGRLVSDEEFNSVKKEVDDRFSQLGEQLAKYHEAARFDTFAQASYDAATMGVPRALKENGYKEVPAELMEEVRDFLADLAHMPTEYFEVKLPRVANLSEFSAAVVPNHTPQKVLDVLKKNGITNIKKYKNAEERREQIGSFDDLLFQSNFYSALEREIGNLKKIANKDGLVSVEQAKAWINSRQKEGKFKQAEVEAVGLMDWLDTLEEKVPVSDVEQFVRENGVQVEEVVLGGEGEPEVNEDRVYDLAWENFSNNYYFNDSVLYDDVDDIAGEMMSNPQDDRWARLFDLNDEDEVTDWKESEGVRSLSEMAYVLNSRYLLEEILGEDKYRDRFEEEKEQAWDSNTDYYLDQAHQQLTGDAVASVGTEFGDYVLREGDTEYKELLFTLPNNKNIFKAPHFGRAQDKGAENIFAHTRINERYVDMPMTDEELAQKKAYDQWVEGNNTPEIKELLEEERKAAQEYLVALDKWREGLIKDTSISDTQYDEAINTLGSNPPEELKPFIKRIEEVRTRVKAKQQERLAVKPPEPVRKENKERVLFIEEIQSDWAQQGRDKGFARGLTPEEKELQELGLLWNRRKLTDEELVRYDELKAKGVDKSLRTAIDGFPTAPFVTDTKAWTGLVVKRLLRYAAENGFDRIAWTTGAQQAERYRLDRFISEVTAQRVKDLYQIRATGEDGRIVFDNLVAGEDLAGTFGTELAEKIKAQPEGTASYTGLEIRSGGQGMREFYDRIVPSVVNDVSRKLGGGKVATISMGSQSGKIVTGLDGKILISYPNGSYLKNRDTGVMTESQDRADGFESREEANRYLDKFEAQNLLEVGRQMSLVITPALREKVMQGLPLFQRDRAGYNPNTFTVTLMDGSDMSSVIHEGGHFYLEALADMASRPDAPKQIVEDFDTTLKWFGVGSPDATPDTTGVRTQGYPSAAGDPIATFTKAEDMKSHPSYAEAKAGSDQAAYDLVNDLVTEDNLEQAKQRFFGATFVPVSLLDKDGANRIPTALAYHYADAVGGSVSDSVFETKKAFHTGMNAMERLVSRANFSGKVEPGRKYVLVDDVTTIGSTLSDLASYIQENGGEVVGSVLLANATRSGKMVANDKTLKRLEDQYGNEIRELFGIEPSALTQEESQYLLGFRTADELRSSAVKAQGSRLSRIHARQVPQSESGVEAAKRRATWQAMSLEEKRPYHEQWAQSFERYALEGVSPTEEMQPVFERFKQWMLETYRSLKEFLKNNPLAGRLNNEVRQVFDRLLASKADIQKTAEARGTLKQSNNQSDKQTKPRTEEAPTPPDTPTTAEPKKPFNPNEDIPETRFRKSQRLSQDAFNRFTVINDWLKKHGVTLSEKADVFQAEERYHSLVANQLEDFRERVRNPLIEKISKAGFTLADVSDFLEAQHAEEANKAIQEVRGEPNATAYGITDAEAQAYLVKADPKLAALSNEFRNITEDSKQLRLKAGLISQDMVDAWEAAYEHYIPVKGDADANGGTGKGLKVNFKTKRRLGHGKRDEAVIENILLDHERAIMQVEKNRVAKHLVMMAAEMNMPEIVSTGRPIKRNVLRSKTAYEVQVNGVTRSVFGTKQAADMFKQLLPTIDKSVQPGTITINPTSDQRVIAMASPMLAENEINAYIDGHAIRVQINDDLLARAYGKLGVTGFSALVSAGRAFNGYLSKVYTGYNPEFILTNMIRDFTSGLVNLTGEEGGKIATKTLSNYVSSFSSLMKYAVSNGKKSDKWIDMYRANGGNTGAAYLSDLERLGDEVKTEYTSYQGVLKNLKSGNIANASRAAGRKAFNVSLKWIYNLNQAGENAMRLSAFRAMIESGRTKNEAAKAAKNITVNFNRKGELGAEANAAYLFFNASVQGTAALAHAHFKGKHKFQAWGLSSMVGVLGYLAAMALIGDDEDDYDKINDYTKSRNWMIKAGEGYAQIPVPYGYGFFWNAGRSMAEAQHKGELGHLPWHLAASAIEELTPFSDTVVGSQDGFQFDQVLLGMLPTVIKIPAQPAFNKQLFSGGEMFPERASQQFQPDREKLWRNTQGTMYDKMAGWLSDAGLSDVSPETLKHYTRTATGGAGALVDATVSAAMLKKEGAELEPSEIPFVRKAYSKLTIKEQRAAYYKAREEAKRTAEAFSRAKTKNDVTTIDKLVKDEGEMLGLDAYANSLSEAIGATRDLQDAIRLDEGLNAAEKRIRIKELEVTEGKFYDQYLDVFKVEKLKMRERNH